jgi:hypothetical protein
MSKRDLTIHMVKLASFSMISNHFRMMRTRQLLNQRKYLYNMNDVNGDLCVSLEL